MSDEIIKNSLREKLPLSEKAKKSFCPLPFWQMLISTQGKAKPCCRLDDFDLGDIYQNSLKDLWNSTRMVSLRKEFLTGDVNICSQNMKHLGCHLFWDHLFESIELNDWQKDTPKQLDLRLSGACNLRCQMCHTWENAKDITDSPLLWNELRHDFLPYVKEMTLSGGEPFVQKSTFDLLRLMKEINPNCIWNFKTNLNFDFANEVQPFLEGLKVKIIQVSLDSLEEKKYEQIRKRGNLSLLLKSLDDLILFRDTKVKQGQERFEVVAAFCAQKDNWREISAFFQFCSQKEIVPLIIYLTVPTEYSLSSLSPQKKEEVVSYLLDHCSDENLAMMRRVLLPLSTN